YYQRMIGSVTNVDQLLGNSSLLNFALQAYGLDPNVTSNATIKKVLTSDLSDPNSYANQIGASNPAYKALAAAFSFQADGSVAGGAAQSTAGVATTIHAYFAATGTDATPAAATYNASYYKANIGAVTNVDDLLANDTLIDYALTAFGLDPALQS